MKQFKDTSIFQGIVEFDSPAGMLQAQNIGCERAEVFTLDESGNSWIFDCIVEFKGKFTCKNIYNAYAQ